MSRAGEVRRAIDDSRSMVEGSLQWRSSNAMTRGVSVESDSSASVISRNIRSRVEPKTSSRSLARSSSEISDGMCNSHVGACPRRFSTRRWPSVWLSCSSASNTGRYGSPLPNCCRHPASQRNVRVADRAHPAFHQGGLPQAGLARDEHHLPRRLHRIFEPGIQLAELAGAAHDAGFGGNRVSGSLLLAGTRGDKAVSAAVQGLNEERFVGRVGQRLADFEHSAFQHALGDVDIGPDGIQQFLLCDQTAGRPAR